MSQITGSKNTQFETRTLRWMDTHCSVVLAMDWPIHLGCCWFPLVTQRSLRFTNVKKQTFIIKPDNGCQAPWFVGQCHDLPSFKGTRCIDYFLVDVLVSLFLGGCAIALLVVSVLFLFFCFLTCSSPVPRIQWETGLLNRQGKGIFLIRDVEKVPVDFSSTFVAQRRGFHQAHHGHHWAIMVSFLDPTQVPVQPPRHYFLFLPVLTSFYNIYIYIYIDSHRFWPGTSPNPCCWMATNSTCGYMSWSAAAIPCGSSFTGADQV